MSGPQPKVSTVYSLQSLKDKRTYVGSTDNFKRRLDQHQSGKVVSTKHRIPFKVLFIEEYATLKEARKREVYYKSGAGRRKLKQYFEEAHEAKSNTGNEASRPNKFDRVTYIIKLPLDVPLPEAKN